MFLPFSCPIPCLDFLFPIKEYEGYSLLLREREKRKETNMQKEIIRRNMFITWRKEIITIVNENKQRWLKLVKNEHLIIVIVTKMKRPSIDLN